MRCPSCSATLLTQARFCPECGAPVPDPTAPPVVNPLDVIPPLVGIPYEAPQAQRVNFEDLPPSGLMASEWTYPMQLTATAWLLTSAAVGVITALQEEDGLRQAVYPAAAVRQQQMTDADALGYTQLVFAAFLFVVIVWALAKLLVAVNAHRYRSHWAFYVILAMTGLDSLLSVVSVVNLVGDVAGGRPLAHTAVTLVMRLAAAALFGWMIVALRRYGHPWAVVPADPASA